MKKNHSSNQRSERGQSLVELAISLTIILLLLSGAVTYGMAYFSFLSITDAAQEGALYGSLKPEDLSGIQDHVRAASSGPVNLPLLTDAQIGVSYSGPKCEKSGSANSITVTVTYNYQIFMPFISAVIGSNTIPLSASATDRILTPQCPP